MEMQCTYVPSTKYDLADGTPYNYEYTNLEECFTKCNSDPQCLGFLDRSPVNNEKVCAWKNDESTLQDHEECENTYYRKKYKEMQCTYVPNTKYDLADGTPHNWEYTNLDECFAKCDSDPK